ncbi:MAG: nitrogenase-stabilizing/protective protein NifW [Alphaproteobacteria bacterium]|nr:nitrogenase-stabilizing/protective protein NifW [Alphaproteobacteria bacterium]MBF0394795.1 nitrogenase-stabilizing/protective protein NifW [Alphaproteobacteria bacterium]
MSDFLNDLEHLSSAEEFLDFFGVEWEPAVVRVSRLHILKRFHDYLAGAAGEGDAFATYRDCLERAYADFVASTPVEQRVFKVLRQACAGCHSAGGAACP